MCNAGRLYTKSMKKLRAGFTIVELLLVVVIIAILAAITIVTYTGVTQRGEYAKMLSDLSSLNKAILMYYADNGSYPVTPTTSPYCSSGNWCGWGRATGDQFIPGLVPKYISATPQFTGSDSTGVYLYRSPTGADYKIIRLTTASGGLPTIERTGSTYNSSQTDRWGYWSSATSQYW